MGRLIRIGTRESALAIAQSRIIINGIKSVHPEYEFELVGMRTKGDVLLDQRLDKLGGKGLFIKELEHALLEGTADIAVHSMKDMPSYLPGGLTIAAVSGREDPRDVLVTADGRKLEDLPEGAVIGTSSIRREVQVLSKRPDLKVRSLRGNVLSRLDKLVNNEYDALILAAAGLKRLGLEDKCVQYFDVRDFIPAIGQGILCIEARENDDIGYLLDSIHCPQSALQMDAERAFMIKLNGGCSTPIAAHAVIEGDAMKLYGMLANEAKADGYRAYLEGYKADAVRLGERLADMIMEQMKNSLTTSGLFDEIEGN